MQTTPLLRLAADVKAAPQANAKAAPNPKAAQAARAVLAAVDRHIIPSYRALAEAADAQEKAWNAFAANRAAGDIEALKKAYNTTADAWAWAQLVKTGPLSLFLRYERFAYWPEARNVTQRMLDQLIKSNDPKELAPETLQRDSVAAQGLTALERLLYDGDNPGQLLKAPGQAGEWRTQVGQGIARNMSSIADDVVAEWTAPDGVRAAIAANKPWKTIVADTPEAASLLLTDLVSAFRLIHDVKLLPVMGASADVARPRVAEVLAQRKDAAQFEAQSRKRAGADSNLGGDHSRRAPYQDRRALCNCAESDRRGSGRSRRSSGGSEAPGAC